MSENPTVSIIINNYNYGRFLGEAIDSALNQTYADVEIIVADDGSTDNSPRVISGYGNRIVPVFKTNGGQASAFNAGFAASHGEIIFFLDSDDVLFPNAVRNAAECFTSTTISKVQWPMWIVDEFGNRTGEMRPPQAPPEGDFRLVVLDVGPTSCVSSPTSGNAWARHFLLKILPVPENVSYYRTCADEYLYTLAPVFGTVRTIAEPQGFYRLHGKNIYSALSFKEKLNLELEGHIQQTAVLSAVLEKHGYEVDVRRWRKNSWFHRLQASLNEIEACIPTDEPIILVDDQTWDANQIFPDRSIYPFTESNGVYNGPPASDEEAIGELSRLRDLGAQHLVFAWPCFWWLEYFAEFSGYLRSHFKCLLENERIITFKLTKK